MNDNEYLMRCMPIVIDRITVTSRCNYWFEINKMANVLKALGPIKRRHIKSFWCDSTAANTYSVTLKKGSVIANNPDTFIRFATEIGELFHTLYEGHNGIWLYNYDDNELCVIDPQIEIDGPLSKWVRLETYFKKQ
jgi:hypothetical protein